MNKQSVPSTMKAWQYATAKGGLENNLRLNNSAPVPKPKSGQFLVRVVATALNPLDFKPVETPLLGSIVTPKGAVPGVDIAGHIVKAGDGSSSRIGELVIGQGANMFAGGGMAEYALIAAEHACPVPEGVDAKDAVTVPIAGLTAYQTTVPFIKQGTRIFINGGSGGVGVFGIQIAKAMGAHVTVSCSTANVEFCKSLGADVVLDYKQSPILEQLKQQKPFDHFVDNIFADQNLYWHAHEYLTPSAKYLLVGASPSLSFFSFMIRAAVLPGFLGGGKRKLQGVFTKMRIEEMDRIMKWMADGTVKPVIDSRWKFGQGVEAMRKMKSGRAKGKVVIEVVS
jgi:NADPH:quinone reductase-like Zn-dependent oxidoreductase